ncbi:hypothetical protein L2E82_12642 [Cichorium intybus]|uniref:Uncharacterized protein n=1 Tax=Cichorium intybus TaxID=13427 RepID=A0ACB9GHW5_CICIN|nr:hypothetical protein L2E82_12642 [Cichorium intybus]
METHDHVRFKIGNYFYFPSLSFQRASGGFGSLIINPRSVIPIPFDNPVGDIIILIGNWYIRNHTALRHTLDAWRDLGMPDGVLINGKDHPSKDEWISTDDISSYLSYHHSTSGR